MLHQTQERLVQLIKEKLVDHSPTHTLCTIVDNEAQILPKFPISLEGIMSSPLKGRDRSTGLFPSHPHPTPEGGASLGD